MPSRSKPPSPPAVVPVSDPACETLTDLPRVDPFRAGGGEPPDLRGVLTDCLRRVERAGLSRTAALKALASAFAADLFSDADSVSIVVDQAQLGYSTIRLGSRRPT